MPGRESYSANGGGYAVVSAPVRSNVDEIPTVGTVIHYCSPSSRAICWVRKPYPWTNAYISS